MADINGMTLTSSYTGPVVSYGITYTKNRPSNSTMTYTFQITPRLGSSASSLGTGIGLLGTVTINGTSSNVRLKSDGESWSGTNPTGAKTVSVTCTSTTGNVTQTVGFKVVRDGSVTGNSGRIDNSANTVLSSPLLYSNCVAPTTCSVNTTVSEDNVTLSWSGAAGGGTGNTISSYEIQYCESSNNSSWGTWTALAIPTSTSTSGTRSVAPPSTRGYYRKFRIRTRGTAGSSYYSGWKESTNSVRKATLPGAPTTCSLDITLSEENVSLSWSGATNGTGPHTIASYQIQYSDSTNNSTWGSWTTLTTVSSTATSGSHSVSPPDARGSYRRFQVRTISANGSSYYSGWKVSSNSVRKKRTPNPPTNVKYNSPSMESTGVSGSTKLYIPEDIAVFTWSAATDPDGGTITYEVQPRVKNDLLEWIDDGSPISVSGTTYNLNITSKPRGQNNDFGSSSPEALHFRVRSKDSMGVYSNWTGPYYAYKRNPTILNPKVEGEYVPAIVYIGVDNEWVKAEAYVGANNAWMPCLDKDYT